MRDESTFPSFFFARVSATGFGLMRIAWSGVLFVYFLMQSADVVRYYATAGLIPYQLYEYSFRSQYRFSFLDVFNNPTGPVIVYVLLLIILLLAMIGWRPRFTVTVAVLMLFSFHERNLAILGGGDTTMRHIGFFLLICPQLRALSVSRAAEQWKHWKKKGALLPPLTMSIWPYRLLLWQIMIIYIYSGLEKLQGDLWTAGTAFAPVIHHPHFTRFPMSWMHVLSALSPVVSVFTMTFLLSWILMLLPWKWISRKTGYTAAISVKQMLLIAGLCFHGGIQILMEVGSFSFAMVTGYCGLLLDEDRQALKRFFNRRWIRDTNDEIRTTKRIAVLYDGKCGLCRRSVFVLTLLDRLGRLNLVDFHDASARKKIDPSLKLTDLDRAMHIKMPSGKVYTGFDGVRALCRHLPPVAIFTPLLYILPVPQIGRYVYGKVAERRKTCSHGSCGI